jgi:hypothetical protein
MFGLRVKLSANRVNTAHQDTLLVIYICHMVHLTVLFPKAGVTIPNQLRKVSPVIHCIVVMSCIHVLLNMFLSTSIIYIHSHSCIMSRVAQPLLRSRSANGVMTVRTHNFQTVPA